LALDVPMILFVDPIEVFEAYAADNLIILLMSS
jgi:hypothetical protein